MGQEPEGVEVHPSGESVWVTGETDHDVTVLDTDSGKVITKISVGNRPRDLAFTRTEPGLRELGDRRHRVGGGRAGPQGSPDHPDAGGLEADGGGAVPDQKRLYVANGRGGSVSVVDVATDSILATVEVGVRPWGIALTRDGRKLYSANGPSNDVTVMDAETMKVLKKIPAGELPWGVVVGQAP